MPQTRTLVIRALIALAIAHGAAAQTAPTVVISPVPMIQFFDNSGRPLAGGCVATYQAGTTTAMATYTDATGMVANQNPVILDAAGRAPIWIKMPSIKYVVKAKSTTCSLSAGTILYTTDNVQDQGLRLRSDLAGANGGALIGMQQPGGGMTTIGGALGSLGIFDVGYMSLSAGCGAATANASLIVTKPWKAVPTQTLNCDVNALSGGTIQPAASQVVTLAGSFQAGRYKVFDTSAGGAGSILFATPAPAVRTSWFGSTSGPNTCAAGDTLSQAWAAAQASLPVVGSAPSIPNINQGEVDIDGNTGIGTTAFCIAAPLVLIPRVTMRGAATATTEIVAAANFAPSVQRFMVNTAQAQIPCNTNFNTSIEHILFAANTNAGNQFTGAINWCPSVGSHLRDIVINTSNLAISWGGPPPPPGPTNVGNSDNNTSDSITCNLTLVSTAVPYPQCIVVPTGGNDVGTTVITNVKVKGVGATAGIVSTIAPAIDPGYGNTTVIYNGIQCETIGWCAVIPDASIGMELNGISLGGICSALASYPRAVMIAPTAQTWHTWGYNTCATYGVVFGSAPNDLIGFAVASGQTVIDPANHIQQVTTAGTNGTTLETAWNDSGATTTWGSAVYTDRGAIGPCTVYVTTNCAATPGAASSSDQGVYGFDCNPERCISFNQANPAINQTTYYQPINVSTVRGNHFTSTSPALITGTGCTTGAFVRDGAGAFNVGGAATCTVTFSANALYQHAVIVLTGTAQPTLGVSDSAHFVVNAAQAGVVYYQVMDTQ